MTPIEIFNKHNKQFYIERAEYEAKNSYFDEDGEYHLAIMPHKGYNFSASYDAMERAFEEYGKQQWNEAIKLAAESVRLSLNGTNTPYGEHNCKQGDWTVNKGFILELLKP